MSESAVGLWKKFRDIIETAQTRRIVSSRRVRQAELDSKVKTATPISPT